MTITEELISYLVITEQSYNIPAQLEADFVKGKLKDIQKYTSKMSVEEKIWHGDSYILTREISDEEIKRWKQLGL